MLSLFRYSSLGILFIFVFLTGCTPSSDHYSPEIQAIKSYQEKRVEDGYLFIDRSFVASPPPQRTAQLKQLAKMISKQAEEVFKKHIPYYRDVSIDYQLYEKTDVINEDFTDIYDSWGSIMMSPDSGEVPLMLNDVGKSHQLISAHLSKATLSKGSACRFVLTIEIYHHYWIFGSRKEQFIDKVIDVPCSEWSGWE